MHKMDEMADKFPFLGRKGKRKGKRGGKRSRRKGGRE